MEHTANHLRPSPPPALGLAGYSGAGKTTLLEAVIGRLAAAGWQVGLLKASHHDVDPDIPGKDSHRLRHAGAAVTQLAGPRRWSLFVEPAPDAPPPELATALGRFAGFELDLVLVEGYREAGFPRIEVHRRERGGPWLFPDHPGIIAVACDETPPGGAPPALPLSDPDAVTQFISDHYPEFRRDP
ncbi:MAG: molybdopterin-guanine dinucleotide biosynthesis protein B [Pseudomonadota bacterium]